MYKVLVTGGLGYIGSHTTVELVNAGFTPVIVDNLSNSRLEVIQRIEKIIGFKPIIHVVDLCDMAAVKFLSEKECDIQGIIHFAACKAVGESSEKPLLCTVYGQPDQLPVTESTPIKPAQSPYGRTKQMAERMLDDVSASNENIRVLSLRYFNPVGAHDSGLIGELPLGVPLNLVPIITQTANNKRSNFTIFGNDYTTKDGTNVRDYVHVTDIAKAHVYALNKLSSYEQSSRYDVYNLSTGRGYSVLEIIETFEEISGVKLDYNVGPRRLGDVDEIWADVHKAENELKWKAQLDLKAIQAMKIIIIGSGPCGLGAAWRAEEVIRYQGLEWKVVEKSDNAGGLAKTIIDDNGFLWDIGAHVIFSHYAYFTSLLDIALPLEEWTVKKREAWVWMRDTCIPYPLQQNLYRLPTDEIIRCMDGLLEVEQKRLSFHKPKNFREWLQQSFGKGLCETFMFPYNFKVWACPLEKMNVEWMGERVATVDVSKVIKNVITKTDDGGWGPNSTFRYPKHGGTGAIWMGLYKKLPSKNFVFSKSVTSIDVKKKEIIYSDGESEHYDALVSTMPLCSLCRVVKGTNMSLDVLRHKASQFRYSSSHIVGFGMQGCPPILLRDKTWLYFPEDNCPFYRVSIFSNFAEDNVPRPGKQWSLMCEIAESVDKPINYNNIIELTEQGLKNTKLIDDRTEIVSHFHIRLEYGYPTPFCGRDALCREISEELEVFEIYSRGRFGSWKYEIANQDHSLMQGVEVIDRILFGVEEMTFKHSNSVNQNRDTNGRQPLPLSY
ncbi:hypothetical protein I4U23_010922 [Adineta vaga]|nr:hypothetical protein I4U23_010922 [Adineta vaga]